MRHFYWQPGDIVVGDSAYCRRQAIIDQLDAGVNVVVRLHWSSAPLQQADGSPFDLAGWLKQVEAVGQGEEEVFIRVRARQVRLRLIAQRLREAAAKRAQAKRKAKAQKHGHTSQELTIQIADWLVVLTSLAERQWSRQQVLSLYRARWQIELLFKRIKQLVRLHRLRSEQMQSNQAVLAAMLVGWILLEQQASQLRMDLQEQKTEGQSGPISTWAICAILAQSLRTMILGSWTWSQIRATLAQTRRLLTCHPQQRYHQESEIVDQLALLLHDRSL